MMKITVAFRNFAKAPQNALAPAAIRNLDRPVHSPVTIPTAILRLQFVTVYITIIIIIIMLLLSPVTGLSPGTSLESTAIPTPHISSFSLPDCPYSV
jgi:hypothetical protein